MWVQNSETSGVALQVRKTAPHARGDGPNYAQVEERGVV